METSRSTIELLRERRFAPYFIVQLLGAFNDNVYKNALIAFIAYVGITNAGDEGVLINVAAGLFILPFFLFSAFAGQVAERFEKSWLIRRIKLAEILIMLAGALAIASGNVIFMIGVLFLMGVQSTFFGPIKYAILPQHLHTTELVSGNGLVELGTFLAILLGTIAGTQLVTATAGSLVPVAVVLLVVAITGWFASRGIPQAPPTAPDLKLTFNPFVDTFKLVRQTASDRVIFQSILGISWFWFLGATYLAQFPVYARDVLGGGPNVFTVLLAVFSVGIGLGSMLCSLLSRRRVEIGLVPLGAAGLTFAGLDLYFATPASPFGEALTLAGFLASPGSIRLILDIALIGVSGGLYIVPLYSLIQTRSDASRVSRTIACNNIMNALFMVMSALLVIVFFAMGASIVGVFLIIALMNALVAAYIFRLVPEFLMRFLIWVLITVMYRVRPTGLEKLPETGAAILAPNHVSFVDALILGGTVRRPVRFVMYHRIYNLPVLNFVFRTARAIPIAGRREDSELYERAFEQMRGALDDGELLCLFPEGQLTRDGEVGDFRPGILQLLKTHPVPVYPVALQGLWKSLFSRQDGQALFMWPKRMFARIGVVFGDALSPAGLEVSRLRDEVAKLRGAER